MMASLSCLYGVVTPTINHRTAAIFTTHPSYGYKLEQSVEYLLIHGALLQQRPWPQLCYGPIIYSPNLIKPSY